MSYPSLKSFTIPLTLAAAVWLAALFPRTSGAQPAPPDEMLINGHRNIEMKLAELLPGVKDARSALAAIQDFTDTRRLAQRVVALDYPLDDFNGIVLVDGYDEKYVAAVDTIALEFTRLDKTPPDPAAITLFRERLGELPPIGEFPAGYVVAFVIGRCTSAATGLPDSLGAGVKSEVAEVAVRGIGELAHAYMATRAGDSRQKSDEAWHLSVIERLRCREHTSGYKVGEERNGLRADGSLYRRYVVSCQKGGESRKLDFDLGILGSLTQSGGRQKLTKSLEKPGTRKPGVDP
jgi:hypothetical protein